MNPFNFLRRNDGDYAERESSFEAPEILDIGWRARNKNHVGLDLLREALEASAIPVDRPEPEQQPVAAERVSDNVTPIHALAADKIIGSSSLEEAYRDVAAAFGELEADGAAPDATPKIDESTPDIMGYEELYDDQKAA